MCILLDGFRVDARGRKEWGLMMIYFHENFAPLDSCDWLELESLPGFKLSPRASAVLHFSRRSGLMDNNLPHNNVLDIAAHPGSYAELRHTCTDYVIVLIHLFARKQTVATRLLYCLPLQVAESKQKKNRST